MKIKTILFSLLFFISLFQGHSVFADITVQDLLFVPTEKMIQANVVVASKQAGGSGVIIGRTETKTFILTVAHNVTRMVVNDVGDRYLTARPHLRIYTYKKEQYGATLFKFDGKEDLALLVVDQRLDIEPIKITTIQPIVGDVVWHIGNPGRFKFLITSGKVSVITDRDIICSLGVYYGSSGGMVINTKGELVGLASNIFTTRIAGRVPTATKFNGVTLTANLTKFLNDLSKKE